MVKKTKQKKQSKKGVTAKRVQKKTLKTARPAKKAKAKKTVGRSQVQGGMQPKATLALAPASKQLQSGAGVPPTSPTAVFTALNAVASAHNFDPAAIAGIINTESVWDTTCVTGIYIGLTQVGPDFVQSLKMSQAQFLALSAADQITAYGKWLDFYSFNAQMTRYKLTLSTMSLATQAAFLQGMQFSPNGSQWKIALANGDTSVQTTNTKQASFLGDTSIGDMATYYGGFFGKHPPVYA
jgi:hypothetical protein